MNYGVTCLGLYPAHGSKTICLYGVSLINAYRYPSPTSGKFPTLIAKLQMADKPELNDLEI